MNTPPPEMPSWLDTIPGWIIATVTAIGAAVGILWRYARLAAMVESHEQRLKDDIGEIKEMLQELTRRVDRLVDAPRLIKPSE